MVGAKSGQMEARADVILPGANPMQTAATVTNCPKVGPVRPRSKRQATWCSQHNFCPIMHYSVDNHARGRLAAA